MVKLFKSYIFKHKSNNGNIITLSYNQNRFIESNDSIIAFNLKIITQYSLIHSSDSHRLRPIFFFSFCKDLFDFIQTLFHLK